LDVNEDGKKDVVVSIFQLAQIYWYEQPATSGSPWIKHLISDTYDGTDMYTGDIDGNGKSDLIISGLFGNKISWFSAQMIGSEAVWTEHVLDDNCTLPGDISLNDMDDDGDLDLVVAGMGTNQMIWYENTLNEQQGCVLTYVLGKDSPRLEPFRKFRDTVMLSTPAGGRLVDAYYNYSPAMIKCLQVFKNILR
jgi:hypothetical protein